MALVKSYTPVGKNHTPVGQNRTPVGENGVKEPHNVKIMTQVTLPNKSFELNTAAYFILFNIIEILRGNSRRKNVLTSFVMVNSLKSFKITNFFGKWFAGLHVCRFACFACLQVCEDVYACVCMWFY